jgi:hypothetical protein
MPRGGKRPGAGRPKGSTKSEGMPSYVTRLPLDIERDLAERIPKLRDILDHWEAEIEANPPSRTSNARYWYAKQMLDEIRELGF